MISRRQFLRGSFSAPPGNGQNDGPSAPKLATIGVACIAYAQNVVCRSCGDACGEAAIRFSPRLGGAACPAVLTECCTGCGDCVPACPAGAITLASAGQSAQSKVP
jgi:ferredoxin-type protein NapF